MQANERVPVGMAALLRAALAGHRRVIADACAVVAIAAAAHVLAARYDLYETFLRWTRGLEPYDIDEAPFAIFVLALALAAFAYRRWREYRAETARRRALEAHAGRIHARLVDAVESIPASLMLFDDRDRLILANSRTAKFFPELASRLVPGARFEDLAQESLKGAAPGDGGGAAWTEARMAAHREGRALFEERRADGRWFQISERRTAEGGIVRIATDVTELKRHEAGLRQAQKMEALGRLTGGIAHDFNNLLTIVLGNLQMLQEFGAEAPNAPELVGEALAASRRGAELTERLLAFARRGTLQPQAVDLAALVRGMAGLLSRTLGEAIAVETRLAPDLWPPAADPGQVENAILNLALNARDAMPEGGRLAIEGANLRIGAGAGGGPDLPPGDYVTLTVRDNGSGMAPEVAERAFEPFFSTKPEGKGTGLGLAMVYGFARQSGGLATIESAPGRGTAVHIYLPRAVGAPAKTEARAAAAAPPMRGTVLLVEDDAGVRRFAARSLRAQGLEVREADSGPAALALLESGEAVDLLFTDVLMPGGMNGFDLAEAARKRRPALRVLFASANPEGRGGSAAPAGAPLLRKPYDGPALGRAVRAALGLADRGEG